MIHAARPLAALAIAASLVLVGCSGSPAPSASEEPYPTSYSAPPPTPVASEAPVEVQSSLPAEIAGVDTSGWQQVPPVDGGTATFRIPPDWTTQPVPNGLAVLRADGEQQLQLTVVPAGQAVEPDGRCLDPSGAAVAWATSRLDVQPVSIAGASDVAFGAAALQLGGEWIVSVGLVPADAAQSPSCPIVHAVTIGDAVVSFGSEPIVQGVGAGAAWAVDSLGAAESYVGTGEYAEIRAILMSLEMVPS